MWKVIAYDTDYGFSAEWIYSDENAARQWADALNFDYGQGCAHVEVC